MEKSYYTYSKHTSREKAEAALEDDFASGEILLGERPRITFKQGRYCIEMVDHYGYGPT